MRSVQMEEAALTGESHSVSKTSDTLDDQRGARRSRQYGIPRDDHFGWTRWLVTETGARSEVGKIGNLIDGAVTRSTPLEQKLSRLGQLLIAIVLVLCTL